MGNFKKLLRPRVIAWAATTVLLVGVLIAANYVCTNVISSLLDATAFGGKRPILDKDAEGIPFDQDFATKEEAFNYGNKVTEEICEEGMVLLKNKDNALPLKAGAKVSVFGKNSTNYTRTEGTEKKTYGLVYGGSGSAAPGGGERKTIYDSLKDAGFSYNESLKEFYESKASGDGRSSNPAMEHGEGIPTLKTGETPISSYTQDIKNSYANYKDAAIVVFSRIAGENWDLPRVADDNNARHYLELDNNERDLLRHIAQSGFEHIIILMNGSNYIDLGFLEERTNPTDYNDFGKNVDACIVIGSPGANGIMALGRILSGKVNPSGHTVDTVYTNYKNDPTWQNFGGNFTDGGDNYLTSDGKATKYYLVEYEENIYMGYRYYETRGNIEGENWYNANVVYPFGYGLSYTTFSEEIVDSAALSAAALKANEKFEVSVKVKNTGSVAGKQVVQLYATAPYTDGGIEKPYKVLVGFAKTKLLKANEEDTVKITVDPYDFASFDNHDKNGNGFKGYELEKGEYIFHVATDAHHDIATFTKTLAEDAKIEKDPVTGYDVKPLFDEVTAHMNPAESLSRSNFAGTFPVTITDDERKIDDQAPLKSKDSTNDEVYTELPKMGVDKGEDAVKFTDLVGLDYNDPKWDEFLDQMTFEEMLRLFNEGCYSTADIQRLGIPKTTSCDGPTGLVAFLGDKSVYGTCYYMSECLLAQTYNVELADDQAKAIGNECLIGDEAGKGTGLSYPGWYAPGVNLHRSPFSGRNTEYYSEDPLLNGKFAGHVIKGVQKYGVYVNVKHFALNDQETHRSANGIATWCDEQAMRELYLRAFEIAVKEGEAHGLMTSFNRIGYEWAGGSYRLVTTILRKEWGFQGSVICDFHTDFYMDSKQMLYAGGDINMVSLEDRKLQTDKKYGTPVVSKTDAKDCNLLRKSAHNNLFAIVNSNAMKAPIKGYLPARWQVLLWVVDGVFGVGLAAWGFLVIFTSLRKKEEAPAEQRKTRTKSLAICRAFLLRVKDFVA